MVTFELVGFKGAARDLKRLGPRVTKATRPVIRKHAAKLVRDIRAAAPVDTGDLRDSVQSRLASDGLTAVVFSDDEIARLIEFGSMRQKARPFFLGTAGKAAAAVHRDITAAVKRGLK